MLSPIYHKIRTPMTVIKGSVDLMKTEMFGVLNAEQRELIELAEKGIETLLTQMDESLSQSMPKVDSHHMRRDSDRRTTRGHMLCKQEVIALRDLLNRLDL